MTPSFVGQTQDRRSLTTSATSAVSGGINSRGTNAKLTVSFLQESQYGAWTQLVSHAPSGSVYSTPEYLDVLCSAAGGRFRILAAERGGELVGGIALYETHSFWGRKCAGRLLLYYNGIVEKVHASKYASERTSRHSDLMLGLEAALARERFGRIEIRNRHPLTDARVFISSGWQVTPSYSYEVSLTDLSLTWERIEQNLRRLIQRSTREGVRFADDDDFESFFKLHARTHERKHVALYLPRESFERYFRGLHALGLCRLFHARLPDGRAISSQLVLLGPHPVSHTVAAALDPDYMQIGATPFLRWKSFEKLAELGFEANDLTDAQLNPVTHFKSQLGGDLKMNLVLRHPDSMGFRIEHSLQASRRFGVTQAKALLAVLHGRKTSVSRTAQ